MYSWATHPPQFPHVPKSSLFFRNIKLAVELQESLANVERLATYSIF